MLRQKLYQETKALHAELEQTPLAMALASSRVSRQDYIAYLLLMASIHAAVEPFFASFAEFERVDFSLSGHARLALIEEDLQALRVSECLQPMALQQLDLRLTFSAAIGWMYVLEGSRLGGKQLAPNVAHIVNAQGQAVNAYLDSGSEDGMQKWQAFVALLNRLEHSTKIDFDEVVMAAKRLFDFLIMGMRHGT